MRAKERQQLMQEHMKSMQENAGMAQGMMGMDCPMMSQGMMVNHGDHGVRSKPTDMFMARFWNRGQF